MSDEKRHLDSIHPSNGLGEIKTAIITLTAKVDTIDNRIDDLNERQRDYIKQRDLDRHEVQKLTVEVNRLAAACPFHKERIDLLENKVEEVADELRGRISTTESSWNDMRNTLQAGFTRRAGSSDHPRITKQDLEVAAKKAREDAEIQDGKETRLTNAVLAAIEKREAEKLEQDLKRIAKSEALRDSKRKKITWLIGIISTIVTMLVGGSVLTAYQAIKDSKRSQDEVSQLKKEDKKTRALLPPASPRDASSFK